MPPAEHPISLASTDDSQSNTPSAAAHDGHDYWEDDVKKNEDVIHPSYKWYDVGDDVDRRQDVECACNSSGLVQSFKSNWFCSEPLILGYKLLVSPLVIAEATAGIEDTMP